MKRLLMSVPIVALTFTGFAPAQADDQRLTEDTPIVFECTGTGGWEDHWSGPRWRFETDRVVAPNPFSFIQLKPTCNAWSSDTADDPLAGDPGNATPLGNGGFMLFKAGGDLDCGNGTLTTVGRTDHNKVVYFNSTPLSLAGIGSFGTVSWKLEDVIVTFEDGIGEVSGTAVGGRGGTNVENPETRDVSGTIIVEDGSTTGHCDDSYPHSRVIVQLELTP